jgi:hypothetical protein
LATGARSLSPVLTVGIVVKLGASKRSYHQPHPE